MVFIFIRNSFISYVIIPMKTFERFRMEIANLQICKNKRKIHKEENVYYLVFPFIHHYTNCRMTFLSKLWQSFFASHNNDT